MSDRIKIEGTQVGSWSVLDYRGRNKNRQPVYWCRCECGIEREVVSQAMRNGMSVSCGCKKAEITSKKLFKNARFYGIHSSERSPERRAWQSMRTRCSPNNKAMAPLYADRGIAVCDRWSSFDAFLEDMGPVPHPGYTLDRKNNDLGYSPSNCRWADCQTQSQNRRPAERRAA